MTSPRVETCALHQDHGEAEPLLLVTHHVQPLGMGGPDEPGNKILICPTGHSNIHRLMGPRANGHAMPAGGTDTERRYAELGVQRWINAGRPGNPHAAYGLHGPEAGVS